MTKTLTSLAVLAMMTVAIVSCNDPGVSPGAEELSDAAKNYLGMQMGSSSLAAVGTNFGPGNPMAESLSRMMATRGNSGGRLAGDSTGSSEPDTIIYDDYQWITCANITTVENGDGSVTTTYDYGDGCYEGNSYYKYYMFGKYSYTSKYIQSYEGSVMKDSYQYDSEMDHYGGRYSYGEDSSTWMSDGYSHYSGESAYDTINQLYSGQYIHDFNDTYQYDSITYTYFGSGSSRYDNKRYIIETNEYSYEHNDDYYRVRVLEPKVYEYDCNPYAEDDNIYPLRCMMMMIYTSGREEIHYRQDGVEGSFIVDYGDGECDSEIVIIENGRAVVIDLLKGIEG
jgi:hypothetical protein